MSVRNIQDIFKVWIHTFKKVLLFLSAIAISLICSQYLKNEMSLSTMYMYVLWVHAKKISIIMTYLLEHNRYFMSVGNIQDIFKVWIHTFKKVLLFLSGIAISLIGSQYLKMKCIFPPWICVFCEYMPTYKYYYDLSTRA